ncbi:hypothetical protein pipiens_002742 [Culex pipiens pipiens]|uniref:Uncharacterized protein n=1 Tax=Culex pipiens pipiens TaxID=38569 RepID=A0ABD1D9X5_CULPP
MLKISNSPQFLRTLNRRIDEMMVKKVRSYKVISLMHKLKAAKVIPSSIVPNYENPYRVSLTFLNRLCTNIPF